MVLVTSNLGALPRFTPPAGAFILNRADQQARSLTNWWPGHSGSELAIWKDFAGTSDALVSNIGTAIIKATEFGNVLDLNAANFIATLRSTPLSGFTVSCWARTSSSGALYLWSMGNGLTNKGPHFGRTSTTEWRFAVWGGTIIDFTANSAGDWINAVCTWDGTDGRIYLDGLLVAGPTAMSFIQPTDDRFLIGSLPDGPQSARWDDFAFDYRLYDRPLSASEVWLGFDRPTRWNLYYELGKTLYFFSVLVPGALSGSASLTITPSGNLLAGGARRITQVGAEVAVQPDERRISQVGAEIAVQPDERRISQLGVEVAVLTSEVGWVPFAFTPSMRVIGSALRGASDFVDASLDSRGIPLDELILDCPTGEVGKDKVVEESIAPGAVSEAHSFNDAASVALNQNDGALEQTHALALSPAVAREMQIFFTFVASTTNVQGDHMLVQAEIKEDAVVVINKSVVLTIAKGNIDHLGTVSFRAMVPAGGAEYTVHMNINDNSTAPTVKNRTMFARDIKV